MFNSSNIKWTIYLFIVNYNLVYLQYAIAITLLSEVVNYICSICKNQKG